MRHPGMTQEKGMTNGEWDDERGVGSNTSQILFNPLFFFKLTSSMIPHKMKPKMKKTDNTNELM